MFEKNPEDYTNPEFFELVERFEDMMQSQSVHFFEESSLEHIIEFYEEIGDFNKVLGAVDFAIEQYPFSAFFLIKKAQVLFDDNQRQQALEVLQKAETFSPSDISVYLLRSDIFLAEGAHDEALAEVDKAFAFADEEDLADLYLEKADVFEDWEKYEEVFKCLKMTLQIDPENYEALERMWFCVELMENYEESIHFHQQLVDDNPYSFMAWYNLANAYAGLGFYEKSVDAFEFVIAINEKYPFAYRDCAAILYKLKNYTKAAEYFLEAAQLNKSNKEFSQKEIYFQLGLCHKKMNDLNRARSYFRKSVKIDPYMHEAFYQIAKTYMKEGNFRTAIHSLERAVKINDQNVKYVTALAKAYEGCEDYLNATTFYKTSLTINPGIIQNWESVIRSLFMAEEYEMAYEKVSQAIKHFPDEAARFLTIKAALLYLQGRKNHALASLEESLSLGFDYLKKIKSIAPNMTLDKDVIALIELYKQ